MLYKKTTSIWGLDIVEICIILIEIQKIYIYI